MKKNWIALTLFVLILGFALAGNTAMAQSEHFTEANKTENALFYKAAENGYSSIYSDLMTPTYYIFAGNKTAEEANALIEDLGMVDNVQQWASEVYIAPPLNGNDYTQEDLDAFIQGVGIARNVKVIGIEDGATFVNDYISQNCYFVAGIMVYSGDMAEGHEYNVPVPAYLSGQGQTAVDYYKMANGTDATEELDGYTLETNTTAPLQNVAVAKAEETLAQAFDNAWNAVFSRNYRIHLSTTEFYNMPVVGVNFVGSVLENAFEPFTLQEIPVFEDLGIIYNQMYDEPVSEMSGAYTWFEYIPETVLDQEAASVPMVVTLHGNQNDPRLQGDASGWVELAAQENFILVSPEYQDKSENNFFGGEGLGDEGVYHLIQDLKVKYPQIDPSRIYVTGLSLGGAKSSLYGIKYSDVFAAVGVVSGVNVFAEEIQSLVDEYEGYSTPYLYLCGDHDFFQMIPVDGTSAHGLTELTDGAANIWQEDPNVHIYSALQAYQFINGLEVTEMDMTLNEYYGMALDDWQAEALGDKTVYAGTLSNDQGVVMKLVAVENLPHWNYKPEAAYIYDFFMNYKKDVETGEVIFVNDEAEVDMSENADVEEESGSFNSTIIIITIIIVAVGLFTAYKVVKKK